MTKKSFFTLFILLCLLFNLPSIVSAIENTHVTVDGKVLSFTQEPVIVNGRTLVPLRSIFEALGAKISWYPDTQSIIANGNGKTVQLQIGEYLAYANGVQIQLETPPQIINNTTMVPVRFVSESMGSDVKWDESSKTVIIANSMIKPTPIVTPVPTPVLTPSPAPIQLTEKLTTEEIGKLSNRVVYIEVSDQNNRAVSSGSGFVVDGGILTNHHVVDNAFQINVEFPDGRTFKVKEILKQDANRDLALLNIDSSGLPSLKIGDSSKLVLGEQVVAIGSPLGFKNSLTTGVVSSVNRVVDSKNFIQISAPVDHGSSGGPLFNLNGEVTGVVSAGLDSKAEINLAIPSTDIMSFLSKPNHPEPVSNNKSIGLSEIKDYLDKNFNIITNQKTTLHLQYSVIKSDDNQVFLIGIYLKDMNEYLDYAQLQLDDNSTLPGLIKYLSDKINDNLSIPNTFFSIYLDTELSYYPKYFPLKSISSTTNGYRLLYNFVYGSVDYASRTYHFVIFPDDTYKSNYDGKF